MPPAALPLIPPIPSGVPKQETPTGGPRPALTEVNLSLAQPSNHTASFPLHKYTRFSGPLHEPLPPLHHPCGWTLPSQTVPITTPLLIPHQQEETPFPSAMRQLQLTAAPGASGAPPSKPRAQKTQLRELCERPLQAALVAQASWGAPWEQPPPPGASPPVTGRPVAHAQTGMSQ